MTTPIPDTTERDSSQEGPWRPGEDADGNPDQTGDDEPGEATEE